MQYGVLELTSSRGLNVHLNTSNPQASVAVVNCWHQLYSRVQTEPRQAPPHLPDSSPTAETQAYKVLGLTPAANEAEVSAAYRRLAQMYHPDKVATLASDFQELAEKRMKEINAAYDLLKARLV